jgi:hypothetical protein
MGVDTPDLEAITAGTLLAEKQGHRDILAEIDFGQFRHRAFARKCLPPHVLPSLPVANDPESLPINTTIIAFRQSLEPYGIALPGTTGQAALHAH